MVWEVSIHLTFLFTFGKKLKHVLNNYLFLHSGYNHKTILYPIEYEDGDQEQVYHYDVHVQKDHQSKIVPGPMDFEEHVHKIFVLLHLSNEMDLTCWTKQFISKSIETTVHIQQQKMHQKTTVVFPTTIFVYEPFEVHGGVLVLDDIIKKTITSVNYMILYGIGKLYNHLWGCMIILHFFV